MLPRKSFPLALPLDILAQVLSQDQRKGFRNLEASVSTQRDQTRECLCETRQAQAQQTEPMSVEVGEEEVEDRAKSVLELAEIRLRKSRAEQPSLTL